MSLRECVKRRAARLCREKHRVMERLLLQLPLSQPTTSRSDTGHVCHLLERWRRPGVFVDVIKAMICVRYVCEHVPVLKE